MEFEHSAAMAIDFDRTQMELRRPFYLCRAEILKHGPDFFEAKFGGVSGIGKTPQIAAIAFDLVWLNGSIEQAAQAASAEPIEPWKQVAIQLLESGDPKPWAIEQWNTAKQKLTQ